MFKLLLMQKVRFYAVVRDKREAAAHESRLREKDPKYRYRPNDMYDGLVSRLFRPRWFRADQFNICFSKRGKSDRDAALKKALETAIAGFETDFGVKNQATVVVSHASPPGNGGLQAVDYFLWALQRFYEFENTDKRESECRYVELIEALTGEINDLDFLSDNTRGLLWGPHRPLTLAARVPMKKGAKKKPGI